LDVDDEDGAKTSAKQKRNGDDERQTTTTTDSNSDLLSLERKKRQEERTGRIRAEIRLRTALQELEQFRHREEQQQQRLSQQQEEGHDERGGGEPTEATNRSGSNGSSSNNPMTMRKEKKKNNSRRRGERGEDDGGDDARDPKNWRQQQKDRTMLLTAIGTVASPYTKRMGTPRQAQLVPASRGYIDLASQPAELLCGMDGYSHVWIIFEFHANTDIAGANNNDNKTRKTKIRPPRAALAAANSSSSSTTTADGGQQRRQQQVKVGQLATRSPHRPNRLGLSQVRCERWDERARHLHVSGLDLVHGTPVYDIKPVVPWDIPGYDDACSYPRCGASPASVVAVSTTATTSAETTHPAALPAAAKAADVLRVPDWVRSSDDVISDVAFTEAAALQLKVAVDEEDKLAPLYTVHNDGYRAARDTLLQILAQDPRSSHRGLKHNARGTTTSSTGASAETATAKSSSSSSYSLIFGTLEVTFVVAASDSTGLPCVRITNIVPVEFDEDQYVDGIPVIFSGSNK
jgi:tRNA (adenine37-N6)-methyltransferase